MATASTEKSSMEAPSIATLASEVNTNRKYTTGDGNAGNSILDCCHPFEVPLQAGKADEFINVALYQFMEPTAFTEPTTFQTPAVSSVYSSRKPSQFISQFRFCQNEIFTPAAPVISMGGETSDPSRLLEYAAFRFISQQLLPECTLLVAPKF